MSNIEFLSYDEQWKIRGQLEEIVKDAPLKEYVFYQYCPQFCGVPISLVYFLSWRAGFRGYGLFRFGKGRLLTLASSMIFPANGMAAHAVLNSKMVDPYRKESPWYWGTQHAIYNQFGIVTSIVGPLMVTYVIAHKMGLLPIPDGMHKPGIRAVAVQVFYSKIKNYMRPIAITAVASTAISFAVGVASYNQSCRLLGRMGRKTLGYREDSIET